MAILAFDGYDHYNSKSDWLTRAGFIQYQQSEPNASPVSFITGRNGFGKALQIQQANNLTWFVFGQRVASCFIGMGLQFSSDSSGAHFYVMDTTTLTANMTVYFNELNYSIQFFRGPDPVSGSQFDQTGTLVYSSPNNVWQPNVWNFIEIWANVDGSAGFVKVYVNGVLVASYTGNTHGPSQNHSPFYTPGLWWDGMGIFLHGGFAPWINIDDFYYGDTTSGPGLVPANQPVGDCRVNTVFAIGDNSVTWTPLKNSAPLLPSTNTSNTVNPTANKITLASFSPTISCLMPAVVTVSCNGNATGHVVLGLYDSDGPFGQPGTLLKQSAVVTNLTNGNNTFTLPSTTQLQVGHTYYWAFMTDATTVFLNGCSTTTATTYVAAQAYSGTMPATLASVSPWTTSTSTQFFIAATVSMGNYSNVSETVFDGDTTYNYTSTAGNEDLLNFGAFNPNMLMCLGLQVTGAYRKDDAGIRTLKQALKIGTTEVYGATRSLPDSYVYWTDLWTVSPVTSTNFTLTELNGLSAGYNLVS